MKTEDIRICKLQTVTATLQDVLVHQNPFIADTLAMMCADGRVEFFVSNQQKLFTNEIKTNFATKNKNNAFQLGLYLSINYRI